MIHYLLSENLKFKRTFSRKLIVVVPLFFLLFSFFTQQNLQTEDHYFMEMVFNWWPLLFMTIGSALLSTLSNNKDRKAGGYRSLSSHGISIAKLWLSKIIVVSYYLLLSSLLLIAVMYLSGLLFPLGAAPLSEITTAAIVVWLTSLGMIPIYLFLAEQFGAVVSILAGLFGMIVGVLAADQPSWIYVPWSWALRLMCPIVGVRPNGVALSAQDALRDSSVILPGIVVSLVFFLVTLTLTSCWFSRREVR
ncbi:lantibiotic immunity ABC transporter MutE/EpiE family permease subunit [Paenibacillus odorifer]|uniref:lantibiotic immunity ABC transporter MutE/EpiE family permease subunit n=1 Tax=Paenibacillus odorifer TaxID=189426 RepID=UPI00096F289A|nr:lantibiotic immunity ABC transporter MutE/EpiE family permease subunit [Paenibacillus odorifer]OMD79788.1 hypothetical protein BSK50_06295 [Paenibacillus odorifer]